MPTLLCAGPDDDGFSDNKGDSYQRINNNGRKRLVGLPQLTIGIYCIVESSGQLSTWDTVLTMSSPQNFAASSTSALDPNPIAAEAANDYKEGGKAMIELSLRSTLMVHKYICQTWSLYLDVESCPASVRVMELSGASPYGV